MILSSGFGIAQAQQAALPASGKVNGKLAFDVLPLEGDPSSRKTYTIEPDGSNKTAILEGTESSTEMFYYVVWSYSPDGTKIALMRAHFTADLTEEIQIYVVDADGTNLQRITDTNEVVNGQQVLNLWPVWSPDGKKLAFSRGYTENRQVGQDIHLVGHYAIYTANADGTNEQKLTDDDIQNDRPAWSPDGTKIAYSRTDFDRLESDIFVMNADGSDKTNITNNGSTSYDESWSPDGKTIAFASVMGSTLASIYNIYTVNADGTGLKRITNVPGNNFAPVWSPDGTKIAFLSDRDKGRFQTELYTMNPDGGDPQRLTFTTDGDVDSVTWQPIPLSPPPAGIDAPQDFVTQHYRDFLNREPDADGLNFWTNEVASCGGDARCVEVKRTNVSAAFFLSIEFQQTGYLVHRLYKAAYGRAPRLQEFLPDVRAVSGGVVVNRDGWEQKLEQNKQAFVNDFVNRVSFTKTFPDALTPQQFVDALNQNAGGALTPSERDALVAGLSSGAQTRADALRKVAENEAFARQEFDRAFVLMQYFGYLRRNPDDPPDNNLDGYNFWLKKLDDFGGNFVNAEMVRSFLVSDEYRSRFAQHPAASLPETGIRSFNVQAEERKSTRVEKSDSRPTRQKLVVDARALLFRRL
jgi:Tol biopolymer transport system component